MALLSLSHGDSPAFLGRNGEEVVTYKELEEFVDNFALPLALRKGDVVIFRFQTSITDVSHYVMLVRKGLIPLVVDPTLPLSRVNAYVHKFKAKAIYHQGYYKATDPGDGMRVVELCPNARVLVPTSGSTGDPKLVAWSAESISSCSQSIASYLEFRASHVATTSLPLFYSYGLSVLHLAVETGAVLHVEEPRFLSQEYWSSTSKSGVSLLSLVPASCKLLVRDWSLISKSGIKTITVAGGRLDDDITERAIASVEVTRQAFFSMYGATEASPRMAYVPPLLAKEKIGAAGIPIANGSFIAGTDEQGDEIIYRGPNVAEGYVLENSGELTFEPFFGEFKTGDIGYVDNDGFLFITGRLKRNVKVNGITVNLDSMQFDIFKGLNVVLDAMDDKIVVFFPKNEEMDVRFLKNLVRVHSAVPLSGIKFVGVDFIPQNANGKTDYKKLRDLSRG